MKRILLTGAGGAASINFARCLKNIHTLIGVDNNPYKKFLAESEKCYLISHSDSSSYIDELNDIIVKENIDFIHAQPYKEVFKISKYRNKLKTKTFLPDHNTIIACTDKYKSYLVWKKAGLKVPETKIIKDQSDIIDMLQKYDKCWIRAPEGAGGLGAIPVSKQNYHFSLNWIEHYHGFNKYLVSEYLSPRSVTFMALYKNGKLIVAQSRERLYWEYQTKFLSGVSGITGAATTVSDPKVNEVALATINAIDNKPEGIFSVDMTYDKEGTPNPTEINIGKFFTTSYFFAKAGLNFPDIYLKLAFDEPIKNLGINPLPCGLYWIRGVDSEPRLISQNEMDLR